MSFSAPSNFRAGNVPLSVAIGDFNADGDPDLAVATGSENGRCCSGTGRGLSAARLRRR